MIYGNLISEIAKYGYTKTQIASCLGISRNTLGKKLRGESNFLKIEFDIIHNTFFKNYSYEYLSKQEPEPIKAL